MGVVRSGSTALPPFDDASKRGSYGCVQAGHGTEERAVMETRIGRLYLSASRTFLDEIALHVAMIDRWSIRTVIGRVSKPTRKGRA